MKNTHYLVAGFALERSSMFPLQASDMQVRNVSVDFNSKVEFTDCETVIVCYLGRRDGRGKGADD